jgi:hypothetical protein
MEAVAWFEPDVMTQWLNLGTGSTFMSFDG